MISFVRSISHVGPLKKQMFRVLKNGLSTCSHGLPFHSWWRPDDNHSNLFPCFLIFSSDFPGLLSLTLHLPSPWLFHCSLSPVLSPFSPPLFPSTLSLTFLLGWSSLSRLFLRIQLCHFCQSLVNVLVGSVGVTDWGCQQGSARIWLTRSCHGHTGWLSQQQIRQHSGCFERSKWGFLVSN